MCPSLYRVRSLLVLRLAGSLWLAARVAQAGLVPPRQADPPERAPRPARCGKPAQVRANSAVEFTRPERLALHAGTREIVKCHVVLSDPPRSGISVSR